MGSLSLLQEIFTTQGSNPGLLHCRQILYRLRHQGSPRILEWVAYPFSKGSSRPRNQNQILHCRQILYQLSYQGSPKKAPLSTGILQARYWSGLPCPPPGNLPNPVIDPGVLHCRWILYHLSHQGNPRILEWVFLFPRGTSQPRNQNGVSCIEGGFFTS